MRLQPTPIPRELLAVTNAYFMLMIELPTATPPLAMTAAYKETDVTIRIRSDCYYSAEYRIAVNPTIRPRSEYEANIRYSPIYYIQIHHFTQQTMLNQSLYYTIQYLEPNTKSN